MTEKPHLRFTRRLNVFFEKQKKLTCDVYSWELVLVTPSVFELRLFRHDCILTAKKITFHAILRNKFNPIVDAFNELEDFRK